MDLIIREVCKDDAEGIIKILNATIEAEAYTVFDTPFAIKTEQEYIVNFPSCGVFCVAETNDNSRQIVGLQSIEPFATYTEAFNHVGVVGTYVDLSLCRRGIGSCLAKVTFQKAKEKGYKKLFTYVRADNPRALMFHLKLGFYVIGTAQKHARIGKKYIDEIIIEKFLE